MFSLRAAGMGERCSRAFGGWLLLPLLLARRGPSFRLDSLLRRWETVAQWWCFCFQQYKCYRSGRRFPPFCRSGSNCPRARFCSFGTHEHAPLNT